MNNTFDIVEKADELRRKSKSKIVMRMIQQTTECAWFIRDYMKIEEFCTLRMIISLYSCTHSSGEGKRMAKNIASSRKDQVDQFKSKFHDLRHAFQAEGVVEIEIAVLRVMDDLQSMKNNLHELGM
jgi:replicative DNA helicase